MPSIPATSQATPHFSKSLLWYSFPLLDAYADELAHGFSSRLGGVSEGDLSALNLGIGRGDDPDKVKENYRRFGEASGFDPEAGVFSWQTHGVELRQATWADKGKGLMRQRDYHGVDGMWTTARQLPLFAHYADCVPLFFYAPDRQIASISHAGWRGTAARMAGVTVRRLASLGCDAGQLVAVVGPSAGPERYQVGEEVALAFAAFADEQGGVLRPDPASHEGKYLLDLWRANRLAMLEAGMDAAHIAIAGLCTISRPDIFYSHRVQGDSRGALAGFVMLK
jgi:polyphenol oxidase